MVLAVEMVSMPNWLQICPAMPAACMSGESRLVVKPATVSYSGPSTTGS